MCFSAEINNYWLISENKCKTRNKCKYKKFIMEQAGGQVPQRAGLMGGVTLPRRATAALHCNKVLLVFGENCRTDKKLDFC